MRQDHRPAAWLAVGLGATVFLVLATTAIPWGAVPGSLSPAPVESVLTAEEVGRAEQFSRWARTWGYGSLLVSLVVAASFGFTRLGPALMRRLRGPWWVRVVQAVIALAVVGRLATLPFALALRELRLDRGLTRQHWTGFAADVLRAEAVQVLGTSLVLVVLMACARRWRRWWPLVAGSLASGLVLAGSFVYPLVVEPLFNDFTPLPASELRSEVLALADREGVRVDEVLVADASRRTTTLNAYVSGFGGTRRVVLYDTLVEDLPRDQALSVVAHELAHARHDDVLVGSTLGAAGAMVAVGGLALLLGLRRDPGRGGARGAGLADPVVVPRVLALLAVATLLASPVQSAVSRAVEARADVVALDATDDPAAFEELQRSLARRSLADPTPPGWSQALFGSHPTVLERIALARRQAG